MASFKQNIVMMRMLIKGYSEDNGKDERYLSQVIRRSTSIKEFKDLCIVFGRAGSLFCIPTLMAFVNSEDEIKKVAALNAVLEIQAKVIERDTPEMINFFDPQWWKPQWRGSKEKFISYVACLSGVLNNGNDLFDDVAMEQLADTLIKEMNVDITPYQSFSELKLCTGKWEAEEDLKVLLHEANVDNLMIPILDNGIVKDPDSQYEENMVNMRSDYLITRLNLHKNYDVVHYMLTVADKLNQP